MDEDGAIGGTGTGNGGRGTGNGEWGTGTGPELYLRIEVGRACEWAGGRA